MNIHPKIIERNGARLSFDCIKTVIWKGQAGRDKNSKIEFLSLPA